MAAQNHIHLSDTLGGAPENAPDAEYSVTKRRPMYKGIVKFDRTLTGRLRVHALVDDTGDPIVFNSFQLQLLVSDTELETLRELIGETVYFVDNVHPDDGEDHTNYVRRVLLAQMGDIENYDPMLQHYRISIYLEDADTVT